MASDYLKSETNTLKRVQELGIPVARTLGLVYVLTPQWQNIIRKYPRDINIRILVCEDLTQGGKYQVNEFQGFNFSTVKNGQELRQDFEKYYQRLIKAKVRISDDAKHSLTSTLSDEIEKSFFVVVDPVTNTGRLVLGDADQIKF